MVMRLKLPPVCSLKLVNDIVAERQNGINAQFFNGIHNEWLDRVLLYVNSQGSPGHVTRWPAIEPRRTSFLNLYLSPAAGSVQGDMLELLRDHDLNLCPACGEAGRPNTLDHYLPKGLYPHYCVTPVNLFPMCDACQNTKKEKTGDANNQRFFIHPYFDVFVAEQVITLVISPPYDKPTFGLVPTPDLTLDQMRLVATHVRELGIDKRYAKFFRGQHRRLLRLVGKMRASNQDVEANIRNFQDNHSDPSQNSWEHIFYSSVLENPDMLKYLTHAGLPDYL